MRCRSFIPNESFDKQIGFFLFGVNPTSARIMMVLVSSLTTPLVYILARKISSDKVAFYASLVHIFYPSFLAYSHYLWSETPFIFLLLLSIYLLILLIEAQYSLQKLSLAALCGLVIGLGTLTRSSMVTYISIVPIMLFVITKNITWRIAKLLLKAS